MVVGDGQLVDIPVPPTKRLTEAVTQKDRRSGLMVEPVQAFRLERSEVRALLRLRRDGDRKQVWKSLNPRWREKLLGSFVGARTANRHR